MLSPQAFRQGPLFAVLVHQKPRTHELLRNRDAKTALVEAFMPIVYHYSLKSANALPGNIVASGSPSFGHHALRRETSAPSQACTPPINAIRLHPEKNQNYEPEVEDAASGHHHPKKCLKKLHLWPFGRRKKAQAESKTPLRRWKPISGNCMC